MIQQIKMNKDITENQYLCQCGEIVSEFRKSNHLINLFGLKKDSTYDEIKKVLRVSFKKEIREFSKSLSLTNDCKEFKELFSKATAALQCLEDNEKILYNQLSTNV
jgi:hypothetical protein